ncbi:MAG: CvpA family protein [Alphaproteobacteria bacterium]|nr:CvpA family protein [Alphaproteobacteria bacterium]MDE2013160.1 CvpA family protein [Alphaproteobacteria bacterium]MDE2075249.1 CvpA family protein [Alphaproteobacteria bacterium]
MTVAEAECGKLESMAALSFQFVDLLVVAVILVSAVFAAYRGFVQETLSILAWAAAAFSALYFGPPLGHMLSGAVSPWVAMLLGYASAFLVVVIPLGFISYRFSENVRRSPVHTLDRSLGFAFGVVRGLVIIGVVYLVFSIFVPVPRQPSWISQARLYPLIQKTGDVLATLVPDQGIGGRQLIRPEPRRAEGRAQTAQPTKRPEKTYGVSDRRALDRLIKTTGRDGGHKP